MNRNKIGLSKVALAAAAAALGAAGIALGTTPAGAAEGGGQDAQGAGRSAAAAASSSVTVVSCNGGRSKSMQSKSVNQPFTFDYAAGADQTVPGTTIVLRGPRRGKDTYLVTYSAETQLQGATSTSQWMGIEAHVDGSPIQPHSGPNPYALTGEPSWNSNSAQFCVRLGRGAHLLRMKTNIVGGTSVSGWLDDYSTSVQRFS